MKYLSIFSMEHYRVFQTIISSVLPLALFSFRMQFKCHLPKEAFSEASILTRSVSLSNDLVTALSLCKTTNLVLAIIFFSFSF